MAVIAFLFSAVLVGAAPLAIARLRLDDELADRWVDRLRPGVMPGAVLLAAGVFASPGVAAGLLAVPWLALTGVLAVAAVVAFARDPGRLRPSRRLAVEIAFGFVAFGATHAACYAVGFAPLGFAPTIVLLTAIHFHAAGLVLLTAGILAHDRVPDASSAVGVALVAIGSVVTAAGFVGVPFAASIGALLVAAGGLLIGAASIRVASRLRGVAAPRLARMAGGALFVSMPIAVAWVAGGAIGLPTFELDVMVRTHGTINALAASIPAMAAWALDARVGASDG